MMKKWPDLRSNEEAGGNQIRYLSRESPYAASTLLLYPHRPPPITNKHRDSCAARPTAHRFHAEQDLQHTDSICRKTYCTQIPCAARLNSYRFHVQQDLLHTDSMCSKTYCAQILCATRLTAHRFHAQQELMCTDSMKHAQHQNQGTYGSLILKKSKFQKIPCYFITFVTYSNYVRCRYPSPVTATHAENPLLPDSGNIRQIM